jgi:hypothetical protein
LLVETDVRELAANEFAFNPCLGFGRRWRDQPSVSVATPAAWSITAVRHGPAIRTTLPNVRCEIY